MLVKAMYLLANSDLIIQTNTVQARGN